MNKVLKLSDFCNMEELEKILSDWTKTSRMAAVVRDNDNNYSMKQGFTGYCKQILASKGHDICGSYKDDTNVFYCHGGLCDFCLPVTLPDGQVIAHIFCGQVRFSDGKNPDFEKLASSYETDEKKLRSEYEKVPVKTKEEIEAAKSLLAVIVNTFVEKNYEKWLSGNETSDDKTLAQITQILYAYNITLNLETGKYTLITGTGLERLVSVYKKYSDYEEAQKLARPYVHPGYDIRLNALLNLESLRKCAGRNGHIDTIEYPVLYPEAENYEWHEVNVFASRGADGKTVINILGRDVTEAHNLQEKSSREIKAAAAKNQILSDLTKMLYSYNITLNLNSGKYSLIEGTGMTKFMEIFKSTDDYPTAYAEKIDYILPEYVEQFEAIASIEALRGHRTNHGFIGNLEYGARTDHGEEWHEINVFISTDEFGNPVANILGRDITEAHKRQEQREIAQKAAAARDQLLSGVTKMLYSFNVTVNLNTWKYSLITGTGCEKWIKILQSDDDYVLIVNKIRNILDDNSKEILEDLCGISALKDCANHSGFMGTVTTSTTPDGKKNWQEINLFMGTNEYGEPVANILGRDITEIHQRQEEREHELKAAAAKDQILSEITKSLYSFNVTVNLRTGKYSLITGTGMDDYVKFLASTDDYEQAHERAKKTVHNNFLKAYNELVSLENLRKKAASSGFIGHLEYAADEEKGIEWHEANVFIGTDENGDPTANILGRDITESHERADTKAKLEIAEAASKSKTQFLFNMSHDIRTPMNAIIGFTDLLEKNLDDKELAKNYIGKIKSSNEFLLSLINNVLEMARIESGKEKINEVECNVYEFNDTLEAVFSSQMKEKNLEFCIKTNVKHPNILCDKTKVKEIYLNLLSNAYKYTPSGGKVTLETTEIPFNKKDYVVLKTVVTDTGIGMSKEFLPHLFEEFSRERNTTESKVLGTGLGMSIVKNLVGLMNGKIEVESEPEKGSKFIVTIPHRITNKQIKEEKAAKNEKIDLTSFAGKRILLAEDNDLNAEIAVAILNGVGFEVEHAADGAICVDMLKKSSAGYYDLILMDIQMPNMNGYEATKTIRGLKDKEKADIKIIAMTANAFEEDKKDALKAGMNGHVAKPIDVNELMRTLAGILG